MPAPWFVDQSAPMGYSRLSKYLGLESAANNLNPTYAATGNLVKYKVFEPGAAAIAAAGLTNQKIPVLFVFHAQGGGEYDGTAGTVGAQCTPAQSNMIGVKLGYGANNDGSLAVPDTGWAFYTILVQYTLNWTPEANNPNGLTASGGVLSAGFLKQRAGWIIANAAWEHFRLQYPNADLNKVYACGVSSGGVEALGYLAGKWFYPELFPIPFAAGVFSSTWIGNALRGDFSSIGITTEDVSLTLTPRMVRAIHKTDIPLILCNSTGDGTIAPVAYTPLHTEMAKYRPLGPVTQINTATSGRDEYKTNRNFKVTIYNNNGGSTPPDHSPTWSTWFGNHVLNGPMAMTDPLWVDVLTYRYTDRPRRVSLSPYNR